MEYNRLNLDRDFMRHLQTDKLRAFNHIFKFSWMLLYKKAVSKVGCPVIAKDLVQDAFVVLWGRMDTLEQQRSVIALLYAILRNKIFHLYEHELVRFKYVNQTDFADKELTESVEELFITKVLGQLIETNIKGLPLRMRMVYRLKREKGLTITEIAENMSISEQTVRNQLHMAYTRLRGSLECYKPG